MRRILSACLSQTMRFDTSNEANPDRDFEMFIKKLDKSRVKYVIDDKNYEADGALVVKIRKQYNTYKTDGYIN